MIIERGPAFIASLAARSKQLAAMSLATDAAKQAIVDAAKDRGLFDWMDKFSLKANKYLIIR